MAVMGDPEEVGREMDKAYPLRWLIIETVTRVLAVVLGCLLVFNLMTLYNVWGSLHARIDPKACTSNWADRMEADLDIRMEVGDDVLRIFGIGVDQQDRLNIFYCWYDKNPLGYIAKYGVDFYDCRGGKLYGGSGGWSSSSRVAFHDRRLEPKTPEGVLYEKAGEIRSDDPYLVAVVERHGVRYEAEIPLTWREAET